MDAKGDVIIVGGNLGVLEIVFKSTETISNKARDQTGARKTPTRLNEKKTTIVIDPRHLVEAGARPYVVRAAMAALWRPDPCVYLGSRYGHTPYSPVKPGLLNDLVLGNEPPQVDSLSQAMTWLARQIGLEKACHHLAEHYGDLDDVDDKVAHELARLAPFAAGRTLATGSYSSRIQVALGSGLTVVYSPGQLGHGLPSGKAGRALLLMLHGSEFDFQNAMVLETNVLNYRTRRPDLAAAMSTLLRETWVVLGADKRADTTFHMLLADVCGRLGMPQRPIFVVDPRPEHEVALDWPAEALRHVRMTAGDFLSLMRPKNDDE